MSSKNESLKDAYRIEIKQVLRGESRQLLTRMYNDLLKLGDSPDKIVIDWLGTSYKAVMVEGKIKIETVEKQQSEPEKKHTSTIQQPTSMKDLQVKLDKLPKPLQRDSGTKQYG